MVGVRVLTACNANRCAGLTGEIGTGKTLGIKKQNFGMLWE